MDRSVIERAAHRCPPQTRVSGRTDGAIGRTPFWSLAVFAGLVLGCDDPTALALERGDATSTQSRAVTALVAKDRWQVLGADEDPWRDERPEVFDCPDYGVQIEPGGYEINTGDCKYITARQPSLAAIEPGDEVGLVFWHQTLLAPTEAMAHLVVRIGEEDLWEMFLPIPGPAAAYTPTLVVDYGVPAGTPIYLHLHNHGSNAWLFSAVEVHHGSSGVSGP